MLQDGLLGPVNHTHPTRISELDTDLSAYTSGLSDIDAIKLLTEDSSRESGGRS
jgi:hypothetical protein